MAADKTLRLVFALKSIQRSETSQPHETDNTNTERISEATVHIHQRFFKKTVLGLSHNYWLSTTQAPWSKNINNRLSFANGRCLSALHDKALDRGFITIREDLPVKLSPKISRVGDNFFKLAIKQYAGNPINIPSKFLSNQELLAYHRENIYQAGKT